MEVSEPVTKEKPTTPKIIINEQKSLSNFVLGRISPYPTVVMVVMHQYKLTQYISQSDLSCNVSIHVPLKLTLCSESTV